MHALFHIKTVIIPRDRYRPEGFSAKIDIGWGMITVLIWKKACINLFITYFNIELKRTKLTSHTDTKLMDMSYLYRLKVLLPKRQQIFPRWTSTFSKRNLYSFYRVLICLYRFHRSERKHHNIRVMAYEVRILIILLYFQN